MQRKAWSLIAGLLVVNIFLLIRLLAVDATPSKASAELVADNAQSAVATPTAVVDDETSEAQKRTLTTDEYILLNQRGAQDIVHGHRAWLFGIDLHGTLLTGLRLPDADLQNANLSYADLTGADLSGSNLAEANLSSASLVDANLSETWLVGTNLTGASLVRANLSEATLFGTDLASTNLSEANLTEARYYDNVIWPEGFDPEAVGATKVE